MDWLEEAIKELKKALSLERSSDAFKGINTDLINKLFIAYINGQLPSEENGDYIYIIKSGEFYKIGITKDIEERLAGLQTGNPIKLEVIGFKRKSNTRLVEQKLHSIFESKRVSGEWFRLDIPDLHYINSLI